MDRPTGLQIDKLRGRDLISEAMLDELEAAHSEVDADQAIYTSAGDTARETKEALGKILVEELAGLGPKAAIDAMAAFAGEHLIRLARDTYGLRRHYLLTVAAMSPNDDGKDTDVKVRAAAPVAMMFAKQAGRTAAFYRALLAASDLSIRPPLTLEEVTHQACNMSEGLLLQVSGNPAFSFDDAAAQFAQGISLMLSVVLAPQGDTRDLGAAQGALLGDPS